MPFTDSVKLFSAQSGSGTIPYADSGDSRTGPSETVVLLNGLSDGYVRNFWAFFPMLALRYRVISFDYLLGQEGQDIETFCEQAYCVIQAANRDQPVHLVGHSYGAAVAALCAARYPHVVRSLTMVAGWAKTDAHQRLGNEIENSLAEVHDPAGHAFDVYRNYSASFINGKNAAEMDALRRVVADRAAHRLKSHILSAVNVESDLANISAPALVVGCTSDLVAPVRHSKLLFAGIDNCRFAQIHSGHAVVLERPAELFKVVDGFIEAPDATPAGHVYNIAHA